MNRAIQAEQARIEELKKERAKNKATEEQQLQLAQNELSDSIPLIHSLPSDSAPEPSSSPPLSIPLILAIPGSIPFSSARLAQSLPSRKQLVVSLLLLLAKRSLPPGPTATYFAGSIKSIHPRWTTVLILKHDLFNPTNNKNSQTQQENQNPITHVYISATLKGQDYASTTHSVFQLFPQIKVLIRPVPSSYINNPEREVEEEFGPSIEGFVSIPSLTESFDIITWFSPILSDLPPSLGYFARRHSYRNTGVEKDSVHFRIPNSRRLALSTINSLESLFAGRRSREH